MKTKKSLKEEYDTNVYSADDVVDLNYDDLNLTFDFEWGPRSYRDGAYLNSKSVHISAYTYSAKASDVFDALVDILCDNGVFPDEMEDADVNSFIQENFWDLVEAYYKELLRYFKKDAQAQAIKSYELDDDIG